MTTQTTNPCADVKSTRNVAVKFTNKSEGQKAKAVMHSKMKFQVIGVGFDNGDFIGFDHFEKNKIERITDSENLLFLYIDKREN